MERTDERVLKDMILFMVLYGIVLQVICLFIPGDLLRMSVGLWIGVLTGIGMAVHMKNALDEALDLGETGAQKYMQKSYAVRYLTVVILFVAVSWLGIANVLTLFAGVMGLKASAYLQPIMHKFFEKVKKIK